MNSEDLAYHILDILWSNPPTEGDWLPLNDYLLRTGLTQPPYIRDAYALLEHKRWAECLPQHQEIYLAPVYKANPNGEPYVVKEAVTLDNAIFKARLTQAGKEECRRRQAAKDAQELVAKQNRAFDPADKRSRTSLTISKIALGLSAIAIGITLYKLWLERDSAQTGQGTPTVQSAPAPEKGLIPTIGDSAKADSAKDSIPRR